MTMMLACRRVGWAIFLGMVGYGSVQPGRAYAQSPEGTPSFEVASVKPNPSGELQQTINLQPGGRLTLRNVPLRRLIHIAHGVNPWQVEGGPDWIGAERFDIIAKAEAPVPATELWEMVRTLLTDRFKLAVHTEARDAPIFALVVARPDRRLGPNLRPSTTDCPQLMREAPADDRNPCGHEIGFGRMSIRGMDMDSLTAMLTAQQTERTVVNRTALDGNFDWSLTWTPQAFLELFRDRLQGGPSGDAPLVNGQSVDLNGPSLFTALEEQLGLKLEGTRGRVPFVIIDHVERPTED